VRGPGGDQPVDALQTSSGRGQVFGPPQTARRGLPGRVEFVQVPAQPVDDPGALGDEVLAVADQQPNLTSGAEAGGGQVRLPQRGAGDGERVDRIGFAVTAGAVACMGHQFGRNPHDALARAEQVTFQTA